MAKIHFGDLYQPKIGPEGEIELVPKGSRKDPWIERRLDRCPICLVRGMNRRGEVVDRTTFGSGRTYITYECHICHYRWVWDKRFKYWTQKELSRLQKETERNLR